jgi:hypothetical protein
MMLREQVGMVQPGSIMLRIINNTYAAPIRATIVNNPSHKPTSPPSIKPDPIRSPKKLGCWAGQPVGYAPAPSALAHQGSLQSCGALMRVFWTLIGLNLTACAPWSALNPESASRLVIVEGDALDLGERALFDQGPASIELENPGGLVLGLTTVWDAADAQDQVALALQPAEFSMPPQSFSTVELWVEPLGAGQWSASLAFVELSSQRTLATLAITGDNIADYDGDGEAHPLGGGGDCADDDPNISPSAEELWYDGVDQNCDGNDDDADMDGYPATAGEDCDDSREEVHPGASEAWYDGVDQDCDGNDADADGDGFDSTEVGGPDCADTDPAVSPVADDLADGVDSDCDGIVDDAALLMGDLVVNELMLEGTENRWIELYNDSGRDLFPGGITISTDRGAANLPTGITLPSAQTLLLCENGDPLTNGGLSCVATLEPWPDASPAADRVRIAAGTLILDDVRWAGGWPRSVGRGIQLDGALLGSDLAAINDVSGSWCVAEPGGSPGSPNPACP